MRFLASPKFLKVTFLAEKTSNVFRDNCTYLQQQKKGSCYIQLPSAPTLTADYPIEVTVSKRHKKKSSTRTGFEGYYTLGKTKSTHQYVGVYMLCDACFTASRSQYQKPETAVAGGDEKQVSSALFGAAYSLKTFSPVWYAIGCENMGPLKTKV